MRTGDSVHGGPILVPKVVVSTEDIRLLTSQKGTVSAPCPHLPGKYLAESFPAFESISLRDSLPALPHGHSRTCQI